MSKKKENPYTKFSDRELLLITVTDIKWIRLWLTALTTAFILFATWSTLQILH